MKSINYALLSIKKNFQNAKELKSTFIISIIGMFINNIAFIILWYNFGTIVGNINNWTSVDVFGLYAFSSLSYGIVHTFFSGLFNIPTYISTGNLDKYISTPKNILLKVCTSDIETSAIGDMTTGVICFIIYAFLSKITFSQCIISLLLIIVASVVFFAFALICMSLSFYLMDGDNISQGIYGTFVSTSLYHGGAFTGILRVIFIFLIPSLLVGAVPVELVKSMSLNNICLICLLSILWLILSITFFYKSLKKYNSNNFFGFGK